MARSGSGPGHGEDLAEVSLAAAADGRDHDLQVGAIGSAIRRLRQQRGSTLGGLAQSAGLSPSFLSLVERGRSALALTSLFNVAHALEVDVADLLPSSQARSVPHPGCEVTRNYAADRTPVTVGERDYSFLAARIAGRVLEPLLVNVRPTVRPEKSYRHAGEEFAWVVQGELVYIVEGEEYRLRPGDAIHVASSRLHALRNDTDEPARAVWVMSQPLVRDSLGELAVRHEETTTDGGPEG